MDEKVLRKKDSADIYIEPGLYPSIVDIVVAMNDKIRKRIAAQKNEYNGVYVPVDKITQKTANHLLEDQSVFIIRSADLERNQTGVMMKGKGPHYPQHSYDIIRIHSLMIYSDFIGYNIVGDTTTPLLQCIPFISKVKIELRDTTGEKIPFVSVEFTRVVLLFRKISDKNF